jgi:L-malate glycosyltransferase
MSKKTLIISQEFPPCVGGAGVVAYQNAIGLLRLGHEVTVLTRDWNSKIDENIELIQVGGLKQSWPFLMALKIKSLNLRRYDSIILNDIGAAFIWGVFFKNSKYTNKTISYLHGGEVKTILQNQKGYLKLFNFKPRYEKLLQNCKAIVSVSHYMKEYFLNNFDGELDKDKIKIAYAGVDDSIFKPVEQNIKEQYNLSQDNYIITSVGRITKDKGYPDMLEIFTKLYQTDKNFIWMIIGSGLYEEELKAEVKKRSLDKNIVFIGRVPREGLASFYSTSLLLLLLVREAESFGLVYVEAQMCGCPAVGTAKYGILEAIENGKSGFLVKTQGEALELLLNKKYLELKKEDILEFANKFSLNEQVKVLESLI